MTLAIKRHFVDLAGELSPENLYCDGERPAAEARRIEVILKKEWSKLEAQIGYQVSEQMAYENFMPEVMAADKAERVAQMNTDPQHNLLRHVEPGRWQRVATNREVAYNVYKVANGRFVVSFGFPALNGPLNPDGDYASLDEAIECGDAVLRGITPESLRQRFPRWEQFAIDREMARAKVS